MKDGSKLYKKLCQYYYTIDKDSTLSYIEAYNNFFDEEDALDWIGYTKLDKKDKDMLK